MKKWLDTIQFVKSDVPYYIILVSAPILLLIYRYFLQAEHFTRYFHLTPGTQKMNSHQEVIYQFAAFFLLTFVSPILYQVISKNKISSNMGLRWGDGRAGSIILIFSIPILMIISYISSYQPAFQAEYPLAKNIISDHQYIFIYELAYVVLYYLAWEFYFRGFLLFGLKNKYGPMAAILIQTISSSLVHIGKPADEAMASVLAGLIFGAIALRTGSIIYTFILHAVLGVSLDLFIIFNMH